MRTEQLRRKLLAGAGLAALGGAVLFAASPTAAQSVTVDAGSVSGTATGISLPGEFAGQTWVAPNTAAWLNKFEFDSFQGTETFYIAAWNGSQPTGPVLFSQTISNGSPQPATLYTNGLQLTAGQSYIVYAGRNGATAYGVNANGYASGLFYETISSAWTPVGGGAYDWVFSAAFSSAGGACPSATLDDGANVCTVDSTLAAGAGADGLGGTDTLQIGDATDYSFDAGRIGTDFVNFETIEKLGAGTLTLTGTGGTTPITVSAGTLVGTTTAIQGDVVNNAQLIFDNLDEDQTDDLGPAVYAGAISGSGHVTFTNGYFQLTGANTYTGGTTVDDAVVAGTTTSIQGDVVLANNGVVAFDQATDGTYAGNVSGTGVLAKAGTGEVTLAGTNTFTGAISISGGKLIGDVDAINQNVSVLAGATVVFDQATDATYSANVNGGGALEKRGAGTLTLTGTSNYDGGTTVSAGKLVGDTESLQGAIAVAGGAQLEFAMSSDGAFEGTGGDGTFGAISGAGSVTKSGTGTLTFGAANTYTGGTTVSGGTIELDHLGGLGSGSVVLNGGSVRANASGTLANSLDVQAGAQTFSVAAGETVTLTGANLTLRDGADLRFGSASDTGTIVFDIGAGSIHNPTAASLTVAGGTLRNDGILAFFTANAGTTTVATGATLDFSPAFTVLFDPEIRNLQGGGTVLSGANLLSIGSGSFDGVLSGTGGLTKYGAGTLRLSGANTLTGATTISGGTLTVADGAALSDTDAVTVSSGATLDVEDGETIGSLAGSGSVTLQSGAVLTTGGDDSSTTFSGGVSGLGGLVKTGTGVFTLTGTNTYSGGTTVLAGELVGTTDSLQGDIVNNAEVSFDQSTDGTYAGQMTGSGSLTKRGTGTVTLTGDVDVDGGTTVEAGTLISVDGALKGDVTNDGVLGLEQTTGTGTFAGDIEGTGSVRKLGAGELVLAGDNSYTGGTSVEAGTLVGAVGALQGDIDVFAGAAVEFDQGSDATYGGALSGDGALVKSGAGKLTLSGTNALTGGMTVEAGALEGTADNLVGNIANNGQVIFAQGSTGTYGGDMDGTGLLVKTGNGVLTLSGTNSYSGGTTVSGGVLAGTTGSIQGDVVNNAVLRFDQAGAGTFAGDLSGTGDVVFQGGGTFTLTGMNTSTGDMTIDASDVLGDTDSLAGDIQLVDASSSVTFDQAFDGDFGGSITGSGSLNKTGAGQVCLTGSSTSHTGGTNVSVGSLCGTTDHLRGAISIAAGAEIEFDQAFDDTFTGAMSGAGGFVKSGAGRLTIADAQALAGLSRLDAGRLIVNGLIGDLQVNGGVLMGTGTIGDLTVLAGTVAPGNSIGTLNVNGDLLLGAGSLLEIEANATSSDRIVATGAATLQGGDVYLSVLPQLYAPGTSWTILQAAAVTGAFGDLTASQSFGLLEARFQYDANAVRIALEFEPDNLYQYAETPNQLEAASGVAGLPTSSALLTALVYAPTDDLAHALDQLSGEVQASLASALIDDTSFQRDATLTRLRNHDASTLGWAVWGAARADEASLEGDVGVATLERSRQAFISGADYTFDNGLRLGMAVGADQGEARIDERASTADTSGWLAEVYGRMDFGRTSLRFGAGWGWQDVTTTRTVVVGLLTETNTGETEATTANAFVDLSRTWDKDGFEIEPFIGAGWAKAELDGYTEVGGSSALTLGSVEADTTFAVAGLRASREFELSGGLLKPYGSLAWEHPFGDIEPAVDNSFIAAPSAPFTIRGASLDQGRALMDLGVSWEKDNIKVGVTYEGAASEEFQRHGGKLYARVAF